MAGERGDGMKRTVWTIMLGAGVLALGGTALADVRTGVEAWERGDFATAIAQWQGPAGNGDADAQFNLAQAYKLGRGVPQDLKRAEQLFGKAAAQGHVQAADNYGLLLFDRGERGQAMPYVKAAAARGDARAQYLLGIAHFNGDQVPKDWPRAYALVTLARQAGLPQAPAAIAQMDGFIPLEQRQQGAALVPVLAQEAEAARARQFASAELGSGAPPPVIATAPAVAPSLSGPPWPRNPTPEQAVAMAEAVTTRPSPRTAGAIHARPGAVVAAKPPVVKPPVAKPPAQTSGGSWRIQLGAFGVRANADALWARVRARPEVAGHARIDVPAGAVIKLQAGGYSQGSAAAACAGLSRAGLSCIAVGG